MIDKNLMDIKKLKQLLAKYGVYYCPVDKTFKLIEKKVLRAAKRKTL